MNVKFCNIMRHDINTAIYKLPWHIVGISTTFTNVVLIPTIIKKYGCKIVLLLIIKNLAVSSSSSSSQARKLFIIITCLILSSESLLT